MGGIVAVNSVGSPCFPGTNILFSDFYGDENAANERPTINSPINPTKLLTGEATTLGIVCTNLDFNKNDLHRIATSAHSGIARAIEPSHTPFDGDIIFSATSGTQSIDRKDKDLMLVCQLSALCITQAVGIAIKAARRKDGDKLDCWVDLNPRFIKVVKKHEKRNLFYFSLCLDNNSVGLFLLPKVVKEFQDEEVIRVRITLENRCKITDEAFVVLDESTKIKTPFYGKVAVLRTERNVF